MNFDIYTLFNQKQFISNKLFDINILRLIHSYCVHLDTLKKYNKYKKKTIQTRPLIAQLIECKQIFEDNETFKIIENEIQKSMYNDKTSYIVNVHVYEKYYIENTIVNRFLKYDEIRSTFKHLFNEILKEKFKGFYISIDYIRRCTIISWNY